MTADPRPSPPTPQEASRRLVVAVRRMVLTMHNVNGNPCSGWLALSADNVAALARLCADTERAWGRQASGDWGPVV